MCLSDKDKISFSTLTGDYKIKAMRISYLFNLGLGAAFLAREKIETRFRELEKKGRRNRDQVKKLMEEAEQRGLKEKKALDSLVREKVREAVKVLDLATREDIIKLKRDLEEMLKKKDA